MTERHHPDVDSHLYQVSVAREGVIYVHTQLEGTADILVRPIQLVLDLESWNRVVQKPSKVSSVITSNGSNSK